MHACCFQVVAYKAANKQHGTMAGACAADQGRLLNEGADLECMDVKGTDQNPHGAVASHMLSLRVHPLTACGTDGSSAPKRARLEVPSPGDTAPAGGATPLVNEAHSAGKQAKPKQQRTLQDCWQVGRT